MCLNCDFKRIENNDCLFVLTVGDFTHSKVENLFSKYFKNIVNAKNINETVTLLNNNHIDIVLYDDSALSDSFESLRKIKTLNEKALIFLATSSLNTDNLLKSIELKLDGYLIENSSIDKILTQINQPILEYINNKNHTIFENYFDQENKSIIISKTDSEGNITHVNDNFCKISGFSYDEIIGKNHNIVRHPDNDKRVFEELWNTIKIKKNMWEGIIKNKTKNGDGYYVKTMIKPILDKNRNVLEYISFNTHISEIMNDKKQLLRDIEKNDLSILALIQIDEYDILEKFHCEKVINKIEKKFGNFLLSNLPNNDIFKRIYFLGNGKYALLCDFQTYDSINNNIEHFFDKFVSKINKSKFLISDIEDELNIVLSFSYGKHMLYEDAKQGLEEASYKKKIVHHSNDAYLRGKKVARKNKDIIKMVKTALDNYNIVSYFQPIINNQTQEIEKYESLVRLIDEKNRILAPNHFLDVTKQGSYYNKITHRVLENTFDILTKINTDISINLSMLDIEKKETRTKLLKLLEKYQQYAPRIVFELLEDEGTKDFRVIKKFIRRVKKRGVKIAIDDFGSGYSSFERLMSFEPDIIKIDGSLIKNIEYDSFSRNLVETIAIFSKKQKIETIAEYVENENIFNILTQIGIDYSQGYFFGKPQDLNNKQSAC